MAYTKEDLERRLAAMVKERGAQAPLVSETIHAQARDAAKRNKALGEAAAYIRMKDYQKREEPAKTSDKPKTKAQPKRTGTPKRDASKPHPLQRPNDPKATPTKTHPLQRPNDPKATPTKNAPEVIQNKVKGETKHAPAKRVSGNNAFDTPMWELMFGDFESRESRYAKNKSTRRDGKVR